MSVFARPKPITGRARPDPSDLSAQGRAYRAQEVVDTMWIDTKRQRAILNEVRRYMRVCKGRKKGTSINGRRLSQFSQAGKSAIAERLIDELRQEAVAEGLEPNPFRVIHITIDPRMTLKMLYQEILNCLADDFGQVPSLSAAARSATKYASDIRGVTSKNIKILEQRVEEWVRKLGVELIIVDEVQRLVTKGKNGVIDRDDIEGTLTADAMSVTLKLQAFLDRGVVPMVFLGDETSDVFFNLNNQFAARLLMPLELPPLNMAKVSDQK